MFSYIKGTLEYKFKDVVVVETGGVGYKINTPVTTVERCPDTGQEIKIYTYLYVRENIVDLIGFLTMEELSMFELLITVSGVGPKAALSIGSVLSPSKFSLAVITNDIKSITKAQGVGPKVAQRIILELKDKMKKSNADMDDELDRILEDDMTDAGSSKMNEAVSALMVLGYSNFEANRAVQKAYDENADLELIVKEALKSLVKK